jgi:hypothetical protein
LIAVSTSLWHDHAKNSQTRVRTEFLRSTGRTFQIVTQFQELPATIFAQTAGSALPPTTLHNPQGYLANYSLQAKLASLFVSSSDLGTIYKTFGQFLPATSAPQPIPDCPKEDIAGCLARTGKWKYKFARALGSDTESRSGPAEQICARGSIYLRISLTSITRSMANSTSIPHLCSLPHPTGAMLLQHFPCCTGRRR